MGVVIAFENPKGGVGKTTVSYNVAMYLYSKGKDVLVVDRDQQGTLRTWYSKRKVKYPLVVGMDSPNEDTAYGTFENDIEELKKKYDYIIIDGAAKLELQVIDSIKAADIIVIPVQPSYADIWGCRELVSNIKQRQSITNGKPICRLLINRLKLTTVAAKTIESALAKTSLNIATLETKITDSIAWAEALSNGLTIFDTKKEISSRLCAEVEQLANEIKGLKND
jgi:chromosome partitioning protein